jgi:methionyl-tRNA formyltransferase
MNILMLGPQRPHLISFLTGEGDDVKTIETKITSESEPAHWADFLISYGYRHIIGRKVLDLFPRRAINLHISFLPFNRGADPNLWSFLEDTPKGVTIHLLNAGLDTGDILARREVPCRHDDTLRTSYNRLTENLETLFMEIWPDIRSGQRASFPQPEGGTSHRLRDREKYTSLLTQGWDTPVEELIGRALVSKPERSL